MRLVSVDAIHGCLLKSEIAQGWVIVGTATQRPVILAFALLDWQVIDAGDASAHQSLLVKFPVLVAIAAKPIAAVVMPFVSKPYGDTVFAKCPDFLDQAVIQLPVPLAHQKCLNGGATLKEFRSISPDAIHSIRKCNTTGIARIPCVFGHSGFPRGVALDRKREWRAAHLGSSACCLKRVRPILTSGCSNVRYWHKADMPVAATNVCFWG